MVGWMIALAITSVVPGASPRALPLAGYSAVPLESGRGGRGYYWVGCEVGGRKVKLIVDTGAPYTVLTPELATRLRLKLGPAWQLTLVGGIESEARPSAVRLKVGAADRPSFPVQVIDLSEQLAGAREAHGVEFAGLLGADFLDDYHAVIDFRGRRLLLRDPPAADTLRGEWRATGLTLRGVVRDGHAAVSKARLVVDGSRFTLDAGTVRLAGALAPVPGDRFGRLAVSGLTDHGQPVSGPHTYYYQLDGDRLRLLMGPSGDTPPAPGAELASTSENRAALWTFERVRPATAPPPRPKGRGVDVR